MLFEWGPGVRVLQWLLQWLSVLKRETLQLWKARCWEITIIKLSVGKDAGRHKKEWLHKDTNEWWGTKRSPEKSKLQNKYLWTTTQMNTLPFFSTVRVYLSTGVMDWYCYSKIKSPYLSYESCSSSTSIRLANEKMTCFSSRCKVLALIRDPASSRAKNTQATF